jgi:hypothetical protein
MPRKLFSSTFGSVTYDSGIIPAGQPVSPAPGGVGYQSTAARYGVTSHDDRLYNDATGVPQFTAGTFMTYDFHDLRDLLEEGECLADAMVGIQRMKETPEILTCYNVAPGRNIVETIIVTNADVDCNDGRLSPPIGLLQVFKAGFNPLTFDNTNEGKMATQRELLYCERRVYAQDQSQTYTSPNVMGSMKDPAGPLPPLTPTRWLNNWLMIDRTVTGEADLVIGPTLMVLRLIEVLPHERGSQAVVTAGAPEAGEYLNNESRVFLAFTPFQLSIVGNKRKLTETEKAIEYSNVFLSNQNDVPSP